MPVRKERNRVLRELAAAKNAAFRQNLLGREFTAVTLDPPGNALTDNFVKATLDFPYTPNKLVRIRPVALTEQGVSAQVLAAAWQSPVCSPTSQFVENAL